MRFGHRVVGFDELARGLEDFGLVGKLPEKVRELHQDRRAAAALVEDDGNALARFVEVAFVGEECRHDLAPERGIRVELEKKRRRFERRAERARADRGLDRAPRDRRILHLAREAVVDRERSVEVAALCRDFGHQVIEERIGRIARRVGLLGGLGFVCGIRLRIVGARGHCREERQRRDDCCPSKSSFHPGSPAPPRAAAPIIERFRHSARS